jgi:hypothetical protein
VGLPDRVAGMGPRRRIASARRADSTLSCPPLGGGLRPVMSPAATRSRRYRRTSASTSSASNDASGREPAAARKSAHTSSLTLTRAM